MSNNDVEEAICYVELTPSKFRYNVADWHFKQPPAPLLKAHLLRIVKGWGGKTALHDYLDDNPELIVELGFEDGLASKTTLWRVWNEDRLSDEHKQVVRTIGQVLVDVAPEHDVPASDEVFHPDPSVDTPGGIEQDDSTVRDRTIAKTREIWQQAKPMVTENYELPRGKNTEVHDNAFLEAHAFIGSEDVGQMFGDVIEEVREEEEDQELPGSEEDKELYMLFETNHPDLELPGDAGEDGEEMSESEKAHMVSRVIRKYKHRWGIENGFKQIKSFRVRTTSMNHEYRFFNFLYACCTMCGDSPTYCEVGASG